MGIEENKKTLQRYFDELMNDGDYSRAEEIIHEDFEGTAGGGIKGIEAHKQYRNYMFSQGTGRMETLEMIAEGDKIAIFQEFNGTFIENGEWQGIKGRGQSFTRVIASIYEFKDGKVVRGLKRVVVDNLSFFQQLGVLPSTEEIIKAYNDSVK